MKTKIALAMTSALTLAAALSALTLAHRKTASIGSPGQAKIFQVHGHVRGIQLIDRTLRIAHDEIPNYMPAMTMSLPVKDAAVLKSLLLGDEVQFELWVTENDSWISHIEKIAPQGALTQAERDPAQVLPESDSQSLQTGELVPDFRLTDQDGRLIDLKDFRGKAVILTFIYTRCPLPNFCPLISKNFAELQQRLSKEFPNKFQLLSISMDPEFDRAEVLKEYGTRHEADFKSWTLATGDAESIIFVAGLMGLYFEKENGLISHDLRTALISPDGRLVRLWKSNVWTPYEVQRSVREVLSGHADVASR